METRLTRYTVERNSLRGSIARLAGEIIADLWPLAGPAQVAAVLRRGRAGAAHSAEPQTRRRRWHKLPGWKVSQIKRLAEKLDAAKRGTKAEIARRARVSYGTVIAVCGGK